MLINKEAKKFARGFEYRYNIAHQGFSYMKYKSKGEPTDYQKLAEESHDFKDVIMEKYVEKKMPHMKELSKDFQFIEKIKKISSRKGFQRFPMKISYLQYLEEIKEKDIRIYRLEKLLNKKEKENIELRRRLGLTS